MLFLQCKRLFRKKKSIKKVIALDPNHKNLVYGVDTQGNALEVKSPHWLKIYDKRIDELKSKRDRCQKKSKRFISPLSKKEYFVPSKRWNKYNKAFQRALHKRREQTKTFMFTVAHKLCKNYDLIGIGNYTPHGNGLTVKMRRAMNNRSLIGRFKNILSWTALKSGKFYQEYDETGTAGTCNRCSYRVEAGLDPSIRKRTCPNCSTYHLRDENAAQNGLKKILTDLRKSETLVLQVPCSGLSDKRWVRRVFPVGIKILRRKDCGLSQAPGN